MFAVGVGLLVLLFGFSGQLPWWTRGDAVLVVIFALIIFGGARPAGAGALLALPGFVLLGEASYSIYILHLPLRLWWDSIHDALGLGLPAWLFYALYCGLVVVASILSFRYVETPLRRLIGSLRVGRLAKRSVPA